MVNDTVQARLTPREARRDVIEYYLSEIIALTVICSVAIVGLLASMGGE